MKQEPKTNYRPSWFAEISEGRGITQMACDVHTTITGGMERTNTEQLLDILALSHVLKDWGLSQRSSFVFDDAVFHLIAVALREFNDNFSADGDE